MAFRVPKNRIMTLLFPFYSCLIAIWLTLLVVNVVESFSMTTTTTSSSTWSKLPTISKQETTTLIPLSSDPLILISSQPLLQNDECQLLLQYLEWTQSNPAYFQRNNQKFKDLFFVNTDGSMVVSKVNKNGDTGNQQQEASSSILNDDNIDMGDNDEVVALEEQVSCVLGKLRKQIDDLTNAPSHDGDLVLPRYLQFTSLKKVPNVRTQGIQSTIDTLLPDGLHSDNTNGMLSRHISALLYLTTNDENNSHNENKIVGGATNFPLAQPLSSSQEVKEISPWDKRIQLAAKRTLVDHQIHHSGQKNSPILKEDCTLLESAAYQLFYKEAIGSLDFFPKSTSGVRIPPKQGHLCVFHNLTPEGTPNHMAFHGGEALLNMNDDNNENNSDGTNMSGKKVLLAFFKTIPPPDNNDINGESNIDPANYFQKKASESRQWFLDTYY